VVAQALGHAAGQRAFARGCGAVDADHWDRTGLGGGQVEQGLKVIGEGFGHAFGVFNANGDLVGVECSQREAHGDAVVVVGVNAGGLPLALH